uniref:Uncharacterized protein n=1 Tax=Nothobranchius korthausae TaxID=1143690 RepID=A0A1A8GR32_9TELE
MEWMDGSKMASGVHVNNSCCLCSKNIRIHRVISNSVLIFELKLQDRTVSDRCACLGLNLSQERTKSVRICRTCANVVTRLEKDLPLLKKWQINEKPIKTEDQTSPRAEKRDCPTPPTPRAAEKVRCSPPPQTSAAPGLVQVTTQYTCFTVPAQHEAGIIQHLSTGNWKSAVHLISKHKELMEEMKIIMISIIQQECKRLTRAENGCVLWKTTPEDLKKFSFETLLTDLQRLSPFLLSVFKAVTKDNVSCVGAAASIALRARDLRMSAFAYYISGILQHGGARKAVFTRLSKMGITTAFKNAARKKKEIAASCGEELQLLTASSDPFLTSEAECDAENVDV